MAAKQTMGKGRIALAILFGLLFAGSIVGMIVSEILSTPEDSFIMIVFPICGFVMMAAFFGFFITLLPFLQRKMMKVSAPYTKEYIENIGLNNMVESKSEIVCPHCGNKNKGDAKFCNNCGSSLMEICPKCGAKVRAGSKFCDQCGEHLN